VDPLDLHAFHPEEYTVKGVGKQGKLTGKDPEILAINGNKLNFYSMNSENSHVSTGRSERMSTEDLWKLLRSSQGQGCNTPEGLSLLNDPERLLLQLVDFQPDATFAIDTEGRVTVWNRAMEDLSGLSASAIIGKAGYEYAVPFCGKRRPMLVDYVLSRDEEILRHYPSIVVERDAVYAETEVMLRQDAPSVLWVKAQPVRDEEGKIIGAIASIRDISGYRKIEKELREVSDRYRALFDRSLYYVYIHDLEGKYLDANEATLEALGCTREELVDMNFTSLIPAEQVSLAVKVRDEILAHGYQKSVSEFTIRKKDGTTRAIESNGALIFRDDKPYAIQGVARDVTERKHAEEAIRESESRYRSVFENVSDFLIIHDLDGTIMETNIASMKSSGYTQDDFKGMNIQDLIPGKYREEFSEYLRRILEKGLDEGLLRIKKKDGDDRIVEYKNVLIRHPDGSPRYIQGSARDITERLKAEKALKLQTEKFLNLLDNIEEAYFEVDLAGNFTFFNPLAISALGYTKDDMQGMNYRTYMDEKNAQKVFKTFHDVFITGKPAKAFGWELMKKDGTRVHVEASIAPLRGPKGTIVGFQGIAADITDRKEAERERDRYEMRLFQAQKMEAIGTLASGVAHDFNNMLSGILGYGELIKRELPEGSRSLAYCEQIIGAGMRARELVQQILSFSRVYQAQREHIRVHLVVEEALKLLRATIPTTIEIQSTVDAAPCMVYCDPTEIHQIVMNLCTNAYQAMEASGGTLSVQLRNAVLDKHLTDSYPALQPGPHVVLSVSDSGCGMDEETRKHIFDPFFTTKERGKGTGLGLATVRRIVNSLKGEIVISSLVSRGSTFTIYLPSTKPE